MLCISISHWDLVKMSLLCKYHWKEGIEVQGGPKGRRKDPISNIYAGNVHKFLNFELRFPRKKSKHFYVKAYGMFQMEFQLVRKQLTHSLTHSLPMGPQKTHKLVSHFQQKVRKEWTSSTHQLTMQDGWCVDRKHFSIVFTSIYLLGSHESTYYWLSCLSSN
jgi:hypothetical protein